MYIPQQLKHHLQIMAAPVPSSYLLLGMVPMLTALSIPQLPVPPAPLIVLLPSAVARQLQKIQRIRLISDRE